MQKAKLMLERVISKVKERIVPQTLENTKIQLSAYKQDSMVYGAAIIAINNIFENPTLYFGDGAVPRQNDLFLL